MRVATFNVLHGRGARDGHVDGDRLADTLTKLDVDVLGLQEVDEAQPRSGRLDLTAVAARAVGASAHRFAAALVGTPGERHRPCRHDDDGTGQPRYGVALLSRWPVRSWHVTRLPAAPVPAPVYVPGPGGGLLLLRDEPRVVLAAVLDTPAGALTVATTHLSFVPGWNLRQLRATARSLRALPAPRLLIGDLNLPAPLAAAVSGWRVLARAATYPAARPRIQLDHILADRHGIAGWRHVREVSTPLTEVSDHRPLVVRFGTGPGR